MEYNNHKNNYVETNQLKTPSLNHIKGCDWDYVYEPSEDTFLLLDALEKDLGFIHDMKPEIVLEVGSGSGVIITSLSQVLHSSHCLAIDINPHACRITQSTAKQNYSKVDVIQADLTSFLKESSISMIIFNPPYVVTPSHEINSKDPITKSWAGGVNGREVIDRFLNEFVEIMQRRCFGYLLLLKENQPEEVMDVLKQKQFGCEVIARRKIRGEELFIVKFTRLCD